MRSVATWILLSGLVPSFGCKDSFSPYNELDGLRVLAMRAEPADLAPGTSTRLDALVYSSGDEPVRHVWSFCPWPSDPNDGFSCQVDEAAWQRAWRKAGLSGAAPSLLLGDREEAELAAPGEVDKLRTLCEVLLAQQAASPTLPPDCATEWKWTVRLTVDDGEAQVDAVKEVRVVLDDSTPNQNPALEGIRVGGTENPTGDRAPPLRPDEEVEISVGIAESSAERYVPRSAIGEPPKAEDREPLTFTWFVDTGSTDRIRSTYREGVESLFEATHNVWTPSEKDGPAKLFVVVRDHRGGVDFRSATVAISD